jgi:Domain of unknown function (DUF5122) beta-propeller
VATSFRALCADSPGSLLIQRDGKLVVAGTDTRSANGFAVGLARCHTDGTLDRSFGRGGRVVTWLNWPCGQDSG